MMPDGQISPKSVIYFLTLLTKNREPWLGTARTRDVFLAVLRAWNSEGQGRIIAVNVLPDHAQVLIELADPAILGQVVDRWKSTTRKGAGYAETFQPDYRERRLSGPAEVEEYALYAFMTPYRDRHGSATEPWPGWWASDPARFSFTKSLDEKGCPPGDWLKWPKDRFAGLALDD